jgi:hypothetical protein
MEDRRPKDVILTIYFSFTLSSDMVMSSDCELANVIYREMIPVDDILIVT